MNEKFHYKGNFTFYFHPTNQIKITKKYLKEIFPPESIKQARKLSKEIKKFDPYKFLNENKRLLISPLKFYKTDLLKTYLGDKYKEQPETIAMFYILLDDILKTITFPTDFNIENDLSQNILIETLNRNL